MAIVTPAPETSTGRRRLALSNPATLEPIGKIEVHNEADAIAILHWVLETRGGVA